MTAESPEGGELEGRAPILSNLSLSGVGHVVPVIWSGRDSRLQFPFGTWSGLSSDALVPPQVKAFVTQDIPL